MALIRAEQHVDDLAQCAVGRQMAVIKQMMAAAEIISFACDGPSLVISPKSTICCSDVKTEAFLRRGLLELGINVGVARRTRGLGVDRGGVSRRAVGVMRKCLCKAAIRSKRLAVIRRHTKKATSLHSTNIWACFSFGAAGMGIAPSTMQGIRSRAADAVCPQFGRCVLPLACSTMRTQPCRPGLGASSGGWCFGTTLEVVRTRVCRAWRSSLEQLRYGRSRWMKVPGPMWAVRCVLFDAG